MQLHCPLRFLAWRLGSNQNCKNHNYLDAQMKTIKTLFIVATASLALQGCVVLAVADLAATAVVKTAGLVVDGTVGAVRMVGGAVTGGSSDKDKDKDKNKDKDKDKKK